mmetsp:Transcript_34608/g.59331  ORF Transcript_34608/g.59331 Transcript_34608/m.59331 type:complete len:133 (+) Transcript_34608:46-444(+)
MQVISPHNFSDILGIGQKRKFSCYRPIPPAKRFCSEEPKNIYQDNYQSSSQSLESYSQQNIKQNQLIPLPTVKFDNNKFKNEQAIVPKTLLPPEYNHRALVLYKQPTIIPSRKPQESTITIEEIDDDCMEMD